jgi:hypothetical protein
MNRRTTFILSIMAALCLAVALPAGNAVAQEKQHVSFKNPAENSKYTQQVNLNVPDVPDHIMRAYEIHRTYPNNAPVINGLKLAESSEQGVGERIDGSGDGTSYVTYVMENGDKFFVRQSLVIQNISGKTSATVVGHITGGTGKFAQMRGLLRATANFDIKTGFNEAQTDIEYWTGK